MKRLVPAAFGAALPLASGTALAAPNWSAIIAADSPAVYAIGVGNETPLNILPSAPQWYGTGFQLAVGGRVEEVTACHMVCYYIPAHADLFGPVPARWDLWPQVEISPLGSQDLHLSYHAFDVASTTIYPNADVAISTAIPRVHSAVILYSAPKPAIPDALELGNFMDLRRGETVMVLGNPAGTWTGARAAVSYFTYEGLSEDQPERPDPGAHFAPRVLPVALVLSGHGIGGMSGGPVIAPDGRVVGVFVAAGGGLGYAIPLDPKYGLPVGGVAMKPAGTAE